MANEVPSPKVPFYVVVQKTGKKSMEDSYNSIVANFSGSCLLVNDAGPWNYLDRVGAGVWSGFIFFLAGTFNMLTARYRISRLIIANLVMGIIATLSGVVLVSIGSLRFTDVIPFHRGPVDEHRKSAGFYILLLITGLVEILLGIISSSLSCRATCCRESENTPSMRSKVMFSQAGGLDQAQIITLANQIQERRDLEGDELFPQPPPYDDVTLV